MRWVTDKKTMKAQTRVCSEHKIKGMDRRVREEPEEQKSIIENEDLKRNHEYGSSMSHP